MDRSPRLAAAIVLITLLAVTCRPAPTPTAAQLPTPFPIDTDTPAPSATPGPAPTDTATPTQPPTQPPTGTLRPTDTPAPPPPPKPTPTPLQPIYKQTKWGVGVYMDGGRKALVALAQAKPGIILLQNPNWKFAEEVRHFFPEALVIGRIFFPEQPLDNPDVNAVAAAEKIAEHAQATRQWVDAWMSYNEPVGHDDFDGYRRWARFQEVFADTMHNRYGIKVVAGNDPPGAIDVEDYPRYFANAIRKSDYFGLHLSAHPDATTFNTPDTMYYGLRYRLIHQELEKAGITGVRMFATENGMFHGWRGRMSAWDMFKEFEWITRQMEQDSYMLGHMAFGIFDPRYDRWEKWQLMDTEVLPFMGAYQPGGPYPSPFSVAHAVTR